MSKPALFGSVRARSHICSASARKGFCRPMNATRTKLAPRGLTKQEAADYCGCESLAGLDDWIRRGIVPGPIPGTHKWDRKAIDAALDRASGLAATLAPVSSLEEWRANRAAKHQRHPQGQDDAR